MQTAWKWLACCTNNAAAAAQDANIVEPPVIHHNVQEETIEVSATACWSHSCVRIIKTVWNHKKTKVGHALEGRPQWWDAPSEPLVTWNPEAICGKQSPLSDVPLSLCLMYLGVVAVSTDNWRGGWYGPSSKAASNSDLGKLQLQLHYSCITVFFQIN